MSFFDSYKEIGSGGSFIKADEKKVLMDEGIPLTITSVDEDPTNKYGPRFVLSVTVPNPETGEDEQRSLGFLQGSVESRDRMLGAIKEYLEGEEAEPVVVKLEQQGRAIVLRQA